MLWLLLLSSLMLYHGPVFSTPLFEWGRRREGACFRIKLLPESSFERNILCSRKFVLKIVHIFCFEKCFRKLILMVLHVLKNWSQKLDMECVLFVLKFLLWKFYFGHSIMEIVFKMLSFSRSIVILSKYLKILLCEV